MILMTDEIRAVAGYVATVHYTHPPRSVVMQVGLSSRADFTETFPDRFFRSTAVFTRIIAGGAETDLMAAPYFGRASFRADGLTEVHGMVIADNCITSVVVNQFAAAPHAAEPGDETADFRMVAFHRPVNGTIAYKHVVKVFSGGRPVSEQEAVDLATSNARKFGLDVSELTMNVTTNAEHGARPHRIDPQTGELVVVPLQEIRIGGRVDALTLPTIL